MTSFPLLSVNVGLPKVIAVEHGEEILSGIDKHPVTTDTVFVHATGIDGDGQADLEHHGGKEKAVYAYPAANWPWWESLHGLACKPVTFGENLTIVGLDESQVRIGDRFAWGDVLLEVSQPRAPCGKLGIHTGRSDLPQLVTMSGRCGWYFRVVREGVAPSKGQIEQVTATTAPTVLQTFSAIFSPHSDLDMLRQLHTTTTLTPSWRNRALKRLAAVGRTT